jgi:hypothetical protein
VAAGADRLLRGLIQLVGYGYGAEPPITELPDGRVSYTQCEFLYARRRQKKTWIIVIGDEYPRDHAVEQLDRPSDAAHPDSLCYQSERRALQTSDTAGLIKDNHLRRVCCGMDRQHEPQSFTANLGSNRTPYPTYEILTANESTEMIEHRRMDPMFYISDDPEVRRKLVCTQH